jgi:hypothetical protein
MSRKVSSGIINKAIKKVLTDNIGQNIQIIQINPYDYRIAG